MDKFWTFEQSLYIIDFTNVYCAYKFCVFARWIAHWCMCVTYQVINVVIDRIRPLFRKHQKLYILYFPLHLADLKISSSSLKWWFGTWKQEDGRAADPTHADSNTHEKKTKHVEYFLQSGSHCVSCSTLIYHTFWQISSLPTLKQIIPWNSNRIKANPSLFDLLLLTSIMASSVYMLSLLCWWWWFTYWYRRVPVWMRMNVRSKLFSCSIKPNT